MMYLVEVGSSNPECWLHLNWIKGAVCLSTWQPTMSMHPSHLLTGCDQPLQLLSPWLPYCDGLYAGTVSPMALPS